MENENIKVEETSVEDKSSKKKFIITIVLLFLGLYAVSTVATYFICKKTDTTHIVTYDSYTVEIINATNCIDIDGNPAIKIYYNFTNNSNKPVASSYVFDEAAYQNGIELQRTWTKDFADEQNMYYKEIKDGATIKSFAVFTLYNTSSDVEFSLRNINNTEEIITTHNFTFNN